MTLPLLVRPLVHRHHSGGGAVGEDLAVLLAQFVRVDRDQFDAPNVGALSSGSRPVGIRLLFAVRWMALLVQAVDVYTEYGAVFLVRAHVQRPRAGTDGVASPHRIEGAQGTEGPNQQHHVCECFELHHAEEHVAAIQEVRGH